jgi:hypothetical protein
MRIKWLLAFCLLNTTVLLAQNVPVLFFSDLIFGPNTGWNNGTSQGAAVTIWGENFGATQGSSYVTINGAQATSYAEWDTVGPARGLERITFFIPTSASTGAGTISVTVNGQTSNTLPFTVAPATIYYIDVTNGNDSNNGLTTSTPFQDLWKFNPCGPTDPDHTPGSCNPSQDGQYIAYVRGGTYTTLDTAGGGAGFMFLRGPYGGPTKQKALIGYPGETPVVDATNAAYGLTWCANYSPYGKCSYFTYAKLTIENGDWMTLNWGDYNRYVGDTMSAMNVDDEAGILNIYDSQYTDVYGNLWLNDGASDMKHDLYIKSYAPYVTGDTGINYVDVGWNEDNNPHRVPASTGTGCAFFVSRDGSAASSTPQQYTQNVTIHDNYFHAGDEAYIYIGDGYPINDVLIFNNIFGPGGTGPNGPLFFQDGTTTVHFYNNTSYEGGSTSVQLLYLASHASPNVLYSSNNIYYTISGEPFIYWYNPWGATIVSDHDLYFNGTTPSGTGLTVTNSVNADPGFVNAAGNNFHLSSSSSPANGAGITESDVVYDYDGLVRPNPPSIGAYEYASASSSGAPNPPTSLGYTVTKN